MSKERELLSRFGGHLAESMGAGRAARSATPGAAPTAPAAPAGASRHDGTTRLRNAAEIDVERIAPDPTQPRQEFDPEAIARLAESLRTHGQIQPISVRWSEDMGRYLIVTGERRWRAARQAGRPTVAAVILDGSQTESQILELQLIENCIREDLQPIEQARAFRALMDRNGWTAARLAEVLHLTGATVSRALALLELPCTVQEAVNAGTLAPSVAYEVSKLDDAGEQAEVAEAIIADGLSRAEAVEVVRRKATAGKGRGAGRGRKATSRTFRAGGYRITAECRRGVEPSGLADALREVLAQVEAAGAEAAGAEAA